jgi:uncharacterized membrane protein YdjX (TVP38/TMEM64 family)
MKNPENLRRVVLVLILVAGIGAAWLYRDHISVEALELWLGQLGWIAPLVFIGCYAIATVFFMPGTLFTLAGGVLFGPRYLASDWATRHAGKRLQKLVEGVENEGWRFVAFVRLVPLFPFNLLNYALGLTRLTLPVYVITSFIFMAPGGAAYTYLGYAGREAVAGGEDVIRKILLAIAIIATIAFVSQILLRMRRAKMDKQGL